MILKSRTKNLQPGDLIVCHYSSGETRTDKVRTISPLRGGTVYRIDSDATELGQTFPCFFYAGRDAIHRIDR